MPVKLDESFDVRTDGSDDRFELRGELDMATVRHFLDAVQPAIESARDVTLDLSRLTFMDSTGISGLFEVGRHAAARVCCLTDVAPRLDNDRGRFLGSLGSRRGHRGPRTTFGAARPSSGRAAPSISPGRACQ
ncbi:MAG: STAS domain-containing protein [Actinobacteria bacterium]|nr:MAG: STAS domain-containing protein [Actinomycetota bacterium]